MAESPSHRFGQIVGNFLEQLLLPILLEFCDERRLYLDSHGDRVGVRVGRKVSWEDKYGNSHDLDFVIEKDGSLTAQGRPVAFIEAAWRRYTKHSRNKAQEIQGAVLPIAEKYQLEKPFLGAVLAGIFTAPSIAQLRSVGFEVVYLPYESVIAAFDAAGVDCRFNEDTSDREFASCIRKIETLTEKAQRKVIDRLFSANKAGFDAFFAALRIKLDRIVERIVVTPLFGDSMTFDTVKEAVKYIGDFKPSNGTGKFRKYEIAVAYSNGDQMQGAFTDKDRALEFLNYVLA